MAQGTRAAAITILGPDGLSGVFYDSNAQGFGQLEDGGDFGALAVEVDGNNRPKPLAVHRRKGFHPFRQISRIEGINFRIDIDKEGFRAEASHDPRGRKKRKYGSRHEVAGADADRHQSGEQGVGSGGHPDCVHSPRIGRHRLLQLADLRAQDKLLGLEDLIERPADFHSDGDVLGSEIQEGNFHGGSARLHPVGNRDHLFRRDPEGLKLLLNLFP